MLLFLFLRGSHQFHDVSWGVAGSQWKTSAEGSRATSHSALFAQSEEGQTPGPSKVRNTVNWRVQGFLDIK